jgi:hypothetical protein
VARHPLPEIGKAHTSMQLSERRRPMNTDKQTEERMRVARRNFLASCGKYAVVTPAAVTLLVAASRQNYATAASGGSPFPPPGNGGGHGHGHGHGHHHWKKKGNNGYGNGGRDGVPGRSNHQDITR